ncbi:MAG: hypothetical protein RMK29_20450 [Myxococcales bacterium]|nr:hypothetical protein [Myxococcota bacterium]MDW8284082.1 hypothetical protein [Myxococcales bacterium]
MGPLYSAALARSTSPLRCCYAPLEPTHEIPAPAQKIALESIPSPLDKAERYHLLNQPDQAESLARDILEISPDHKGALRELGLALTDQFDRHPTSVPRP